MSGAKILLLTISWVINYSAQAQFAFNIPDRENDRIASYSAIFVEVGGKLSLDSHSDKGHIFLNVSGGVPPYTFKWNTKETSQNRTNLSAGTYTVLINDSEGSVFTQRVVIQPPFPLILNSVEKNGSLCGSVNHSCDLLGCSTVESDIFQVNAQTEMGVIPSSFTPNGDKLSDTFKQKLSGVSSFRMEVYNTCEEILFNTTSLEGQGWDGTYQGHLVQAGNFFYQITYTTLDRLAVNRTGGISLIR